MVLLLELGVVSFNIAGPAVDMVVAENACLFTANGEVAITIIAAIVVVLFNLVSVFVGVISTMDRMISNHINKEGCQFHLWIPLLESRFGIRL
jgi:hypothetical protein